MRAFKPKNAETVHLWLAILLVATLALQRLACFVLPAVRREFAAYWENTAVQCFSAAVFLYLLILLWVAYRRWQSTIVAKRDLELILKTISPDVLLIVSPDRRITECNELVREVFGYTPQEVIGRQTDLLYFDRRITSDQREIFLHLERVGFHVGQARGRRKDGSVFPLELVTVELRRQAGAVVLIRDITERKRAEDRLLKAKEDAEAAHAEKARLLEQLERNYRKLQEAEQARDHLTHMVVHDLKSPLTSLLAYIDLLRHTAARKLSDDEAGFLREALALGDRLTWMIHSLLDISRLESGALPLNLETGDTAGLIDEALRRLGPEAGRRAIAVHVAPAAATLRGDRDLIGRVLTNLLGNAVKFTPEGGAIDVAAEPDPAGIRFRVRDRGPGIDPADHERIFERFGQAQQTPRSTGLGLTFCKLAVEAHGGRIGVDSEPGQGSVFWFVLPAAPPEPPRPA